MFNTLLLKEIQETIQTYRFIVVVLLCLILIPLGMYVTMKDYEQRLTEYRDSVRLYQERSEGRIRGNFRAEGYRPPSAMGVFSIGLEYLLPNKVVTSEDGKYQIKDSSGINNPHSQLFGKVDYLFIVGFVLSLLALIFTFSSISGEKESNTLRLIMSNPIPRWEILIAKSLGNYIVFIVPFITALIIGLLILSFHNIIQVFSLQFLNTFFLILLVTLLYTFSMFNLGMLISTLSHRSLTSIVTLLFVWVIMVLVVPKISPMIAEAIYPIKTLQVIQMEKDAIRNNLEGELDKKRRELFDKTMMDYGIDPGKFRSERESGTDSWNSASTQYKKNAAILENEYQDKINSAIGGIEQDYATKRNTQTAISVNLSRISPVCCFTYVVTELSGTGLLELENFHERAKRFQEQVKNTIYDNYVRERYANTRGSMWGGTTTVKGFDSKEVPVPHLSNYRHTTITEALETVFVDIVLLALFSILFFAGAFVSFLRYDVR